MARDFDSTLCAAIVRGWGLGANCHPCAEVRKLSDAQRSIQHLKGSPARRRLDLVKNGGETGGEAAGPANAEVDAAQRERLLEALESIDRRANKVMKSALRKALRRFRRRQRAEKGH